MHRERKKGPREKGRKTVISAGIDLSHYPGLEPRKDTSAMSLPPVSVELEMKAYNDSTREITTLLDSTTQLDSMDVIMSSRTDSPSQNSSSRSQSETCVPANPVGRGYADPAGRIIRIAERGTLVGFVMGRQFAVSKRALPQSKPASMR